MGLSPCTRTLLLRMLACVSILFACRAERVRAQATDVRQVIREIEATTSYRFLYRDALLAGRLVELPEGGDRVASLRSALSQVGLAVAVDESRNQVLIYRQASQETERAHQTVSGHVVDEDSGTPLPFATVTWLDEAGQLRGVAANEAGYFQMELPGLTREQVTVSYLGFESTILTLDVQDRPMQIAVRLRARPVLGREVVVSGTLLHTDLDSTWQHLIRPGILAPLGESSVFRSLQALPSISITTALSDGVVVRGSKSDGFQVLLDGLPIYSQTHMFGLFDAFNEEALQTVALFYGIAPAAYQAPPGGTMSFLTRTGSQESNGGSLGLSNTSLRLTAEGPLARGKGSWLVSGRKSYLGELDWFGNDALIAQGLDVGRQTSLGNALGADNPFSVLSGDADYFDIHAKVALESRAGGRFTATGYAGGDRTEQAAERRLRLPSGVVGQSANAASRWGSSAVGTRWEQPAGRSGFFSVLAGVSSYYGQYDNDSVVGVRRDSQNGQNTTRLQLERFGNHNRLLQLRASPRLTWGGSGVWSAGADLSYYDATYSEATTQRPVFELNRTAAQVDLFGGYSSPVYGPLRYEVGVRTHYYSTGNYWKFSPRIEIRAGGDGLVSASIGYSRNHQFLHQIEVQPVQESAPDVWILSSETESPGRVDYWTTGLYLKPLPQVFLQVEGYSKRYRNMRLHETANPDPRNQGLARDLNTPWLTDVDGRARGLEVMLRHRTGPLLWSHSYALARMVYSNPRVLQGREFFVSWDRRHQYTGTAQLTMGSLTANLTWSLASGTPNPLRFENPEEGVRLPTYSRLDLGVEYEKRVGTQTLSAGFSLYNVLDRDNVWYRQLIPVEVSGPPGQRVVDSTLGVDVYDLGIHPSFELGVRF